MHEQGSSERSPATAALRLSTPVKALPGIGPGRAQALARLGIATAGDLLRHLPMRYQEVAGATEVSQLAVGTIATVRGTIEAARWVPNRRGSRALGRFEATLSDGRQRLSLVWFNGHYLGDKLLPGLQVQVTGKVQSFDHYRQMANPRWEILHDPAQSAITAGPPRLQPVYPATEKLSSPVLEKLIDTVLDALLEQLPEPLPADLLAHHAMPTLREAYRMAHRPDDGDQPIQARRRLAYNEMLLLQLAMSIKRRFVSEQMTAPALHISDAVDHHIRQRFPFTLTAAQLRVIAELRGDLTRTVPMNRLLQGDVGSGKTVIALYAMLAAVATGHQALLLAPTEILAEQHFSAIAAMLEGASLRMALLTGQQAVVGPTTLERREPGMVREALAGGAMDLVVGTHALLAQQVRFASLAVVVIDEQHRFGVEQRAAFRDQARAALAARTTSSQPPRLPHHLVMTATPIPRTLGLTLFGDLDISTLDEKPPGRGRVVSRVVDPAQREEVYGYLRSRLDRGEQAYVVVPTIEEQADERKAKLKSVKAWMKTLAEGAFAGLRLGCVHGRLDRQTREKTMRDFREGRLDVLVATTVIEVGVDVPNAMLMVIEHAERFGLAQLHQLRGRIGRNRDGRASLCVLIGDASTENAAQRLAAMSATHDGFRIADEDFQIRGMGAFLGTQQSGIPPFRVARLPEHLDLLRLARRDAQAMVQKDPMLTDTEHQLLHRVLWQQYGQSLGLVDIG